MDPQALAAQLRQPTGDYGTIVGEQMNIGNLLMNQRVLAALALKGDETLLEIGMGNGYFVSPMLSEFPGVMYTGVDFSAQMVEQAIANNLPFVKAGKAKFITGNAAHLPLKDASIDKAFAVNTLYFWETPSIALKELYRVLKPGGMLFIGIRPKRVMENMPFTKYGFKLYTQAAAEALLSTVGFTNVNGIETIEPPLDFNGNLIEMGALIITGLKP